MADERALGDLPFEDDWTLQRGATFYKKFALELDDVAWDLTKATITLQVDTAAAVSALIVAGTVTSPETGGEFEILITAAQMALVAASYNYGIRMVLAAGDANFADGATFIIQTGAFVVEENVFSD